MRQVKKWLKAIFADPGMVSTALKDSGALAAPSAQGPDHRFHDLRSRLATKPDEIVRRTLRLILLRARANSGSQQSLAILRSLPQLAPRRQLAVDISFKAARFDPEFQRFAQEGNAARNAKNWLHGISAYERALALYPLHCGYRVQLSHCFKEHEQFEQAEIGYRNALAQGASLEDVWPHLEYSVHFGGGGMRIYPPNVVADLERHADNTADLDLTHTDDVKSLAWLFLGERNFQLAWLVRMLRAAPRRSEIIEHLMNDPMFSRANRPLLALAGRGDFS
jgi:tetratricopeptide (TPR) repeat protein